VFRDVQSTRSYSNLVINLAHCMTIDADVIVVGSGPSGVSAGWPMLEAGMRVILLDGGKERVRPPARRSYHEVRRNDAFQWRTFLGDDLESLRPSGPPSPKFDAPGSRSAFEGDPTAQHVEGRDFAAIVSMSRGGLSNIWGAGVTAYGDDELSEFPLTTADLVPSYHTVARRMGVTGFVADDLDGGLDADMPSQAPMPLAENARRVLARYERRRKAIHALGVRIGSARTAVLTQPLGERGACALCDMCVWGCSEGAIYNAAYEMRAMRQHAGLDYRPGTIVESIAADDSGWRLAVRNARGEQLAAIRSRRLVLAAGGLATTRLVLEMQGRFDEPVPVVGAPGLGFALCLPERIAGAVSTREFSMGQLSFLLAGDASLPADYAYGTLFPASGLPASMVIERMPLTRPAAVRLFARLQPSLLLGNCFLPGRYGRSAATLERYPEGARLVVRGGVSDELPRRLVTIRRQLGRAFRALGAFVIPGSISPIRPGEDVRYAGTLPMRAQPGRGEVDRTGELYGAPGLHVVDLACFPAMPAKQHTLTMMANADRIGRIIAGRWSDSPGSAAT
jgi:choline dehydrogenase-like flavoprotein